MSRRSRLIGGAATLVTLSGAGAAALALSRRPPTHPTTITGHSHTTPTATTIPKGAKLFLYNKQDNPYALAWSPDSKRILSGSWQGPSAGAATGAVVSWDALTGNNPITYQGQLSYAGAVAWSPDGALVAAKIQDFNYVLYIWDAASGAQKQAIKIDGGHYQGLTIAWSPNGKYLAVGTVGNSLQLLDTRTFQVALSYNPIAFTGAYSLQGSLRSPGRPTAAALSPIV
jgi:WD40 repeat protein